MHCTPEFLPWNTRGSHTSQLVFNPLPVSNCFCMLHLNTTFYTHPFSFFLLLPRPLVYQASPSLTHLSLSTFLEGERWSGLIDYKATICCIDSFSLLAYIQFRDQFLFPLSSLLHVHGISLSVLLVCNKYSILQNS